MGFLMKKPLNLLLILAGLATLGFTCKLLFVSPDSELLESGNMYFDIKFIMNHLSYKIWATSYEADLFYYTSRVWNAPKGSLERKRAQQELKNELSHRKYVYCTFQEIGKAYFGNAKSLKKLMESPGVDDWNCYYNLIEIYQTLCGSSTYTFKYLVALANICSDGFQPSQFTEIATQVCGSKCNSFHGAHLREKMEIGPSILPL